MSRTVSALQTLRQRAGNGPPGWLPTLATLLVVAASIGLGRSSRTADLLLGAGLVAAAALVPALGMVALVAGSLTSQIALPTGSHTDLRFPLLAVPVLGLLWLLEALWRRDLAPLRHPAARAAAALALVAGAALVVGNLPTIGFRRTASIATQLGGFGVFAYTAAVVVLAADRLRDPRWLRRVVWVFTAIAGALVAGRLIPELARPVGWLVASGASGSLTWLWFAALASAHAALNGALNWRVRVLLALAVVAELYVALGANREWVAGWMPALVAIATIAFLAAPRLSALAAVVGGMAMATRIAPMIGRVLSTGDNQYSLDTRLDAARILLSNVLPANPLLGLGPSNYYQVTPLFPIRGYSVNFSSHNTYVDLLMQTGVLGVACFAWLIWAIARAGWRARAAAPSGFVHAYAVGALGGLAGMLAAGAIGDWLLPFPYNVTLAGLSASLPGWVFLGGLVALSRSREPRAMAAGAAARRTLAPPRLLFGIIAAAVLLRVAVALMLGDTVAPISGAADQVSYDALARRVVGGHGFSFPTAWYPFAQPDTPTAHWSYLYTLYLAGVYAVFGHHPLVARLLQAVASGLGCWLACRIGRHLFDERVGLAAAALTALYAYFVFFNAALMTQTFFILALLAAIDRALAIAARPTTANWATLGILLGLGTLLRQTMLLYVPVLLIWLLWTTHGRARWRDAALAAALVGLCVLPWTARNYAAFGDFLLLNSNGGYFFYASNHPDQGTTFDPTFTAPIPVELVGAAEPTIDRALFRTGLGFVADDPVRVLRLSLNRAASYFWLLPSSASTPLSNAGRLLSFTLYLPFMLYGLVLSRQRWRACMPLYLYVLVDAVLHLATWAAPRYRLPSDALLIVFAGLALVDLTARLRRRMGSVDWSIE
jgi:4-amino-4-deoxy-L-arabinose transferase-like glycosyltransferase